MLLFEKASVSNDLCIQALLGFLANTVFICLFVSLFVFVYLPEASLEMGPTAPYPHLHVVRVYRHSPKAKNKLLDKKQIHNVVF